MRGDMECTRDYIVIPSGSEDGTTMFSNDRYCGLALGHCVETTSGNCEQMAGAVTSKDKAN